MNATKIVRKLISLDIFEDQFGGAWVFNAQRGWVSVPASSRSVVQARQLRVLVNAKRAGRNRQMLVRIARTLDGGGWWASHQLKCA